MCEFDEELNEINIKRKYFNKKVEDLSFENPKLYRKLEYILGGIDSWMISAQDYMNELKKYSVTTDYKKQFEALRKNINDLKNSGFSEKHNKQNGF